MKLNIGQSPLYIFLAGLLLWVQIASLAHIHVDAPQETGCLFCTLADRTDLTSGKDCRLTVLAQPVQAPQPAAATLPPADRDPIPQSRAPPVVA